MVKAKADLSIGWNAFAITGATLLTLANLFIWFVGGVLA
ncbi:putative membrane protein [Exiguobacterium sp. S17]|nr:putative membrane protein [Exiguobacterium sp. S17]